MKHILRLFLTFALILVTTSINAGTTYGCQDYYTMKIGERLALRRNIGHYPSNWTRVNWFIGYSGKSVKIVSQDYDYCTIEAEAECSNVPVYCQMYYNGDLSTLYYDITVKSNGKLTITASPAGGSVLPGEKVTLSTNYSGATIYYTLNGSTPTTYSSVYTSSGITIDNSCTLKALAVKSGYTDSNIFTADYTVSKTFTAKTVEGVDMKFSINSDNSSCRVEEYAINRWTSGSVTIPSSIYGYPVTHISNYAFEGCSTVSSVVMPNSISTIGWYAFKGCSNLSSIILSNSLETITLGTFMDCVSLTTINIPNSVTSIGEYAFRGCYGLTNVTIPNSVASIDKYAFRDCKGLISVDIPNSVTNIGDWTFYNCSSLASVNVPNSVARIGKSAFYNCSSLTNITIPNTITRIENQTFQNCTSLESVTIPSSVTSIGDYAFYGCSALETLTGCKSVERVGSNAFYVLFGGTPWESNLPEGINYIGKVLYLHKGKVPANTTINIPAGCTQIYNGAFTGKVGLVGVNIPASVTKIASGAFCQCPYLQTITVDASNPAYDSRNNCNAVIETATNTLIQGCSSTTIPNNVTSIGASAFNGNWTKDEILVPNQIDSIARSAFRGNNNVKSILIGKGLRKIDSYAFTTLPQLKEITVATTNPYFDSRDNCNAIIEKTTNALVVGCTGTIIPNTVKTIGEDAFYGNGNESFTSLVVPSSVEEIKAFAFEYLSHLRNITIGENVKTFGNYILYGCKSLEAIESLNGFPDDIDEKVFDSGNKDFSIFDNVTLYVPVGCRNNYRLATGWSNFKNIVEGPMEDDTDMLRGDANGDGIVSVTDIVATANHILGATSSEFNTANADSNLDGIISVTDIVYDAQYILTGSFPEK